jgi:hypothetical protein
MRAREFLSELGAGQPSLAAALKLAAQQQQQQQQKQGTNNPNASTTGQGTQGTQGSGIPSASGGKQPTPDSNLQSIALGGPKKPASGPGIMQAFTQGLTGGRHDSLASAAFSGAGKALGMNNTVGATNAALADPEALGATFSQGQSIDVPGLGKVKINKSGPDGLELDTSQAPSLGVKKMTVDLKQLAQQK